MPQISDEDAATRRIRLKTTVALPGGFLSRLIAERLFFGPGTAAKLYLTLYAMSPVYRASVQETYASRIRRLLREILEQVPDPQADRKTMHPVTEIQVEVTYRSLGRQVLGSERDAETGHKALSTAMAKLETNGLVRIARRGGKDNLFTLESIPIANQWVTANLWKRDYLKTWSGAELLLYLLLTPRSSRVSRRGQPNAGVFVKISAVAEAAGLSPPTLRNALRTLVEEGIVTTILKDGERWASVINPELWPKAEPVL